MLWFQTEAEKMLSDMSTFTFFAGQSTNVARTDVGTHGF